MATHDTYIAQAPEQFQEVMSELRRHLAKALPNAEEIVAYNMPGFREDDRIIAGYAAFSMQCGLYVHPDAIAAHQRDIAAAGLKATKTGVTFTVKNTPSADLIAALAMASRKANGL